MSPNMLNTGGHIGLDNGLAPVRRQAIIKSKNVHQGLSISTPSLLTALGKVDPLGPNSLAEFL